MLKRLFDRFYSLSVEDAGVRVLYFFNTIDSYCVIAGVLSWFLYYRSLAHLTVYGFFILVSLAVVTWLVFRIADFHPLFVPLSLVFVLYLIRTRLISPAELGMIVVINTGIFVVVQFLFMSIPESIAARDGTIGPRKIINSLFTIAPTTVSFSMSVYFSCLFAAVLVARPYPLPSAGAWFWGGMVAAALITRACRPRPFVSLDFRPEIQDRLAQRVIILNIDGCRLDRFYEAELPFLSRLEENSTYFPSGLQTVYRALTNPAFASMLTGALPAVHGIKNNNLGQRIRVEALPDLVSCRLYGSMHVKHFSKPHWDTSIVSLVTHGALAADDVMFCRLEEDLLQQKDIRLFSADISETDFTGHAYGSESHQYLEALRRADGRIGDFFTFLEKHSFFDDTVVIICSDHGMVRIDHSYLLFAAERYVPCIMTGCGIHKKKPLAFQASIMDIAPTVCYLLGIRYPASCRGRVFVEALTGSEV